MSRGRAAAAVLALVAFAAALALVAFAAAQQPSAAPARSGADAAPEWTKVAEKIVAAEWRPLRAPDGARLPDAPWRSQVVAAAGTIAALREALRAATVARAPADGGTRGAEPVVAEWTLHLQGGQTTVLPVLGLGDGVVRCRRGESAVAIPFAVAASFGDLEPAREAALRTQLVRTAAELQAAVAGEAETIVLADGSDLVLAGAVVASGRARLWIRAERPGRPVTIRVADPKAYVFEFVDCGRVALQDVRLAHVDPPGRCDQGVVTATRTRELRLLAAELHGSGTHGVEANDTARVLLIDSTIRDCSWRVAQVRRARTFVALRCSFLRSRSPAAPSFLLVGGSASFADCTFADLGLDDHPLVDARGTALTFAGGAIDRLPAAAAPPVPWEPPPR